MKVCYSIIDRGAMIVRIDQKTLKISGELKFNHSVFYADINPIKKWEKPFDKVKISNSRRQSIIESILEESRNNDNVTICFD